MPKHNHTYYKTSGAATNKDTGNGTAYGDYLVNTSFAGGNQPHSIVQPTMLYHWLIKAKNVVTLGGYTEDFEVTGDLNVLGKLIMPEDKFASSGGAIDMRNSDIVNANSIWMGDEADGASEGILFLKQGATPGSSSYADYECLSGFGGNLYYNGTPIVESGSNSNGTWIKWMDGTMICCKRVTGTVNITEKYYDYFYHTADDNLFDLGDYPQEFIELPRLNVQFVGGNCQWIGSIQNNDKLHIGDLHIISVTSKTAGAYYEVIAIGKWK